MDVDRSTAFADESIFANGANALRLSSSRQR
jgi:hypothetical protein